MSGHQLMGRHCLYDTSFLGLHVRTELKNENKSNSLELIILKFFSHLLLSKLELLTLESTYPTYLLYSTMILSYLGLSFLLTLLALFFDSPSEGCVQ